MVDLKISLRAAGEELQYLKEGLRRQLVVIVELKSGGGCKLARSSTTDDAEKVDVIMEKKKKMQRIVAEMEAMAVC
jgi:hypothetical protein